MESQARRETRAGRQRLHRNMHIYTHNESLIMRRALTRAFVLHPGVLVLLTRAFVLHPGVLVLLTRAFVLHPGVLVLVAPGQARGGCEPIHQAPASPRSAIPCMGE
jgi:hypothetical protein